MPSKGGRSTAVTNPTVGPPVVASQPPSVSRSREEWDTAGFTATELAQPLRRGVELQRFNELVAREDDLPPEEAEELYRYRLRRVLSRLRQLSRARTHADEEGIRTALDDLDARLEELRRLEHEREMAGLPIGYELGPRESRAPSAAGRSPHQWTLDPARGLPTHCVCDLGRSRGPRTDRMLVDLGSGRVRRRLRLRPNRTSPPRLRRRT